MLADDEALHLEPAHQNQRRVAHGHGLAVITGDHAAQSDAAEGVHAQHHGVHHHAANVFKVTVHPRRARLGNGFGQRAGIGIKLVVDAGVKAQLGGGIAAFFRAARNADHAATTRFGQRRKCAAHSARRRAHHQGLAGLGLDDLDQPVPGGHARHADRTQVMRQRHVGGVHLAHRAGCFGIDHAVFLPATHAHDLVAGAETGRAALNHFARRAALHHLAQCLRYGIAFAVVHAAAHVRVQAQEMVAHQHLAVLQSGRRAADQLEVAGAGFALRPVVQQYLLVDWHKNDSL